MAKPNWPAADQRTLLGTRINRMDGPAKVTGAARYSADIHRPGMLYARLVTSSVARAEVVSMDTGPAEALAGVKGIWREPNLQEVQYVGQILAAVAAETEEIAAEAANLVRITYKPLEHQVRDDDPALSRDRENRREVGKVDDALGSAEVKHEGSYGCAVITHCCLEPHGQVCEVRDGELHIWPSTQNASRYADQLGEAVGLEQNKIRVDVQYMGGGFGSKFNFDKWGIIGGLLAKNTGRPVKLMLDRELELAIAGNRPSAFATVKVGAGRDGKVTAFDSTIWGTSGPGGSIPLQMPYVFTKIPNHRTVGKRIVTNRGSARAWRAPNHPQNCLITMAAMADMAARLEMDELEFFLKNLELTDRPGVYREQLGIAADLIGYRNRRHARGDKTPGPIKRGVGVSIHTWGGQGHASECDVILHPDGSVEAKIGTQDLGTGARTCVAIVVAETLGLPLDAVRVDIGRNDLPQSGPSGGSTTIGGTSTSSRLAATDALNALLERVSQRLGVAADTLEAREGVIRQIGKPTNQIAWKDACALLGPTPITKRGACVPADSVRDGFISSGVGGAQIAAVAVDVETGVVTLDEMVAVQDCGLIINLKTAESQVFGALIMGITYALYEEAVYDPTTGRMLNADMEFYRLAGIQDVGKLKVHMMTGPAYEGRGVIGLGEPPVISPGAAISNAVANATGVRVPHIPLTPDRVLAALAMPVVA